MVKGTSRRVIVVDSPDQKLFEQAIFIVRNDAFSQDGVTPQQVLGEACRIARGCAASQNVAPLAAASPLVPPPGRRGRRRAYRPGIFSDLKGADVCRQSDKSTFVKGDFT